MNSPAERWNPERTPGAPSSGKYGKNWDAPSIPSACSPPSIIRLIPFLCRLEPCALPRPLEHESLGFFSGRMLEKLPWAPADLPVLRQWMEENR